ncbi:YceK/YidQ family lipoprotein [Pseudomonas sp. LRP2-20]|uniref:YceK/YidQ family lipoprotein n=1 Tax=Pseudomonas sp. LRP2-20 TaxID=2944234 RepID=UPI00218B1169|nr:YceK/YidQ family lipoprotein [Pseudomonas sp. LRP2-20]BDM22153.1 YceK/YidQ family lipoprotein [Pseudomonas sp. LRP2-20]
MNDTEGMTELMKRIAKCLVLTLPLLLSGCWSTLIHLDGERCVYPGTRLGWNFATQNGADGWVGLIDVPFSFALDTVLLPYDLTAFLPQDMGGENRECNLDGSINVM